MKALLFVAMLTPLVCCTWGAEDELEVANRKTRDERQATEDYTLEDADAMYQDSIRQFLDAKREEKDERQATEDDASSDKPQPVVNSDAALVAQPIIDMIQQSTAAADAAADTPAADASAIHSGPRTPLIRSSRNDLLNSLKDLDESFLSKLSLYSTDPTDHYRVEAGSRSGNDCTDTIGRLLESVEELSITVNHVAKDSARRGDSIRALVDFEFEKSLLINKANLDKFLFQIADSPVSLKNIRDKKDQTRPGRPRVRAWEEDLIINVLTLRNNVANHEAQC